jgi:hypothetical protein
VRHAATGRIIPMGEAVQRYVIRSDDQRQGWRMSRMAADGLRNAVMGARDTGRPIEVRIQPFSPPRTDPQRKTLWMWHGEVGSELSIRTQARWTKDDVHEVVFIPRFMPAADRELIDPETGEVISRRKRTTEATKPEITEAMDAYLAWIYGMGIEVTVPEAGW